VDITFADITTPMEMHWTVWLARLVAALVLCGVIGFEREIGKRPAGLRTHMLTGLAAALYTLVMLHMTTTSVFDADKVQTDPIRVIEAVTQGVAFLAAGLVVFSQGNVLGLKTGATMWLCAAIGVCCALGLLPLAATATATAVITVVVIRFAEKKADTHSESHASHDDESAD
jgi:putative Mg2+ transporter-C (MgtC) family protein